MLGNSGMVCLVAPPVEGLVVDFLSSPSKLGKPEFPVIDGFFTGLASRFPRLGNPPEEGG